MKMAVEGARHPSEDFGRYMMGLTRTLKIRDSTGALVIVEAAQLLTLPTMVPLLETGADELTQLLLLGRGPADLPFQLAMPLVRSIHQLRAVRSRRLLDWQTPFLPYLVALGCQKCE